MNARELRIGNYLHDGIGRLCRVEEIDRYEFKAPAIVGGLTTLPNKPITLTEEWLLRFGFTWNSMFHEYLLKSFDKIAFSKELACSVGEGNYPIEIGSLKYVHQLQNLYFALTGDELKITQ